MRGFRPSTVPLATVIDADEVSMRPVRLLPLSTATAIAGVTLSLTAFAGTGSAAPVAAPVTYQLTRALDMWSQSTAVVRWAPCVRYGGKTHAHVIHYKVNPAGKSSRVRLVKRAVRRLHRATGLTFAYDGRTRYIPHANLLGQLQAREQERRTHVPLVIAWAFKGSGSHASNLLQGTEQGVGTIKWASSGTSQLRINDAAVVMERGQRLPSGFQAGGSVGTLLQHELGHAVGLQHAASTAEIMYPFLGPNSPGNYASGDRTGLRKVGATQGCMKGRRLPATNS